MARQTECFLTCIKLGGQDWISMIGLRGKHQGLSAIECKVCADAWLKDLPVLSSKQ
jgi:formate dehydrogenase maturation protein FdhE